MKNLVLIGGGNQAHYTIDIIEKENKYKTIHFSHFIFSYIEILYQNALFNYS